MGVVFWILPRYMHGSPRGPGWIAWLSLGFLNLGIWLVVGSSAFGMPALALGGRIAELTGAMAHPLGHHRNHHPVLLRRPGGAKRLRLAVVRLADDRLVLGLEVVMVSLAGLMIWRLADLFNRDGRWRYELSVGPSPVGETPADRLAAQLPAQPEAALSAD